MNRKGVVMTRIALLLAVLTAPLLMAEEEEEPKPSSDSLKERWKLRLMPEKVPLVASLLADTVWVQKNLKNIQGVGEDYALRFDVPSNMAFPLVHFTTIEYRLGSGQDSGPGGSSSERKSTMVDLAVRTRIETTREYRLVFDRSFLEFNGLVHTAVVIKDKQLILDACIPVGAGKWYRVSSCRGSDGGVSVTEYLFEFQDDPLQKQEGKAVVHVNTRTVPKVGGGIITFGCPRPSGSKRRKASDGSISNATPRRAPTTGCRNSSSRRAAITSK